MQLKNDIDGRNLLRQTVAHYYLKNGQRSINNFLDSKNNDDGFFYAHFLLERKHIFRYGIGEDRHMWVGGLELAIGPHYFGPSSFWTYDNSERFKMDASTEAIERNLMLLDEFLCYPIFL